MEMPIFDITFTMPLDAALMKFFWAWRGVTPVSWPEAIMSSMLSNARYGLMAAAPNPFSSAMWWTSRASPDSTTRPTRVRALVRTRWWWTAATSSSEGMGASSDVELRSDRTITSAPSSMAAPTWARTSSMAAPQGVAAPVHREQAVDGEGPEPRRRAVLVDVQELGQVVVVDDRHGEDDLAARVGRRLQQVRLGPEGRRQRGDQLLADGVERRVGHLGEQLGEVVVEEARPLRQDGDGRVRPHRPDGLGPGPGHGGDDEPELLVGVAEQLLAPDHRGVLRGEHGARRQVVEVDLALLEPRGVGVLGGQGVLDLVVVDDATGLGVHQEHPAGLEASLADHLGGRDVEDADLAGQDHQVVVGHPVPGRDAGRCGRARRR